MASQSYIPDLETRTQSVARWREACRKLVRGECMAALFFLGQKSGFWPVANPKHRFSLEKPDFSVMANR